MPNPKNIEPHKYKKGQLSRDVAATYGSLGGKAKAANTPKRKAFQTMCGMILNLEPATSEDFKQALINMGFDPEEKINIQLRGLWKATEAYLRGEKWALEFFRDTVGEKPVERAQITQAESKWFKRAG